MSAMGRKLTFAKSVARNKPGAEPLSAAIAIREARRAFQLPCATASACPSPLPIFDRLGGFLRKADIDEQIGKAHIVMRGKRLAVEVAIAAPTKEATVFWQNG